MPAYFRCKNCGHDHPTPLHFVSDLAFESARLGASNFFCPVTHKTSSYEKRDMWWVREEIRKRPLPRQTAQTLLTL